MQVEGGIPKRDPSAQAVALMRKLSQVDFGKAAPAIAETGEISAP